MWFKNDGQGNFSEPLIISDLAIDAESIHSNDLDGDGDIDILSVSYIDDKVAWYENDGEGNFGDQIVISTEALEPNSLYIYSIDNDRDTDVITASWAEDKIAWYENLTNSSIISGVSFFDENYDGLFDASEHTADNIPITIIPDALASYTDVNGIFRFYVPNGTYELTYQIDSCYTSTG